MNARQEWLLAQWDAACKDPELAKIPHKVELNEWGKIELTPPAPPLHGRFGFRIASLLEQSLGGAASVECPVLTDIGVRVPDVVWVSSERRAELDSNQPLAIAPEICIEIVSPANTLEELRNKTTAYLQAGAREVIWFDPASGVIRWFSCGGELAASQFAINLDSLL